MSRRMKSHSLLDGVVELGIWLLRSIPTAGGSFPPSRLNIRTQAERVSAPLSFFFIWPVSGLSKVEQMCWTCGWMYLVLLTSKIHISRVCDWHWIWWLEIINDCQPPNPCVINADPSLIRSRYRPLNLQWWSPRWSTEPSHSDSR